jgi:phosphoenolpyruvate carboxykinase (ATP)
MKYLEFETPASKQAGELASDYKLKNHGLDYLDRVFWNLPVPALVEEAIFRGEGHMVAGGPFIVNTGKWSARAAADKYIVKEPENENRIWWGEYNRPASLGTFNSILVRLQAFLQGEELVRAGLLRRGRPGLPHGYPRHHRKGLAQPLCAEHVHHHRQP